MLPNRVGLSGRPGLAGPAALLLVLAILALLAGDRLSAIESAFYDFLQRQQTTAASDRVLIVETSESAGDLWSSERFRQIVQSLNAAGADRIVPVQPPPETTELPDLTQLTALVRLEEEARRLKGKSGDAGFADQLSAFRRQYEQRAAIEKFLDEAGNVVVAMPHFKGLSAGTAPACNSAALPLGDDPQGRIIAKIRRMSGAASLAPGLCSAVAGTGIGRYWPDADRVVRRTHLLVNAAGRVYPALALAGVLRDAPATTLQLGGDGRLRLGDTEIYTGAGFTTLNRYYPPVSGQPAFATIDADALLANEVPASMIAGRIVVIGRPASAGTAYRTPIEHSASETRLLATSLSNLLNMDFVLRPAWFRWFEWLLVLLLAATILVSAPVMTPARAGIAALALSGILLTAETWLFLSRGFWVQLVTPAIFVVCGVAGLQLLCRALEMRKLAAGHDGAAAVTSAPAAGQDELDLEFSVLRQQPPTEETKQKLFEIAMKHGRRKEFAKAERVLRHLASLDPEFRNVGEKLRRLSGARIKKGHEEKPADDSVPMPKIPAGETGGIQTLGRYQIDKVLGRGAMATVYLGRDPAINRKVAIKTIALSEEFSDESLESARQQFMREAESAGRLNHPNIIAIYDAGEDNGVSYLAMEYFEGCSLAEHARAGNLLPPKWVLELMARAAEALQYAHGQNVVHRDVKPANVLYDSATDSLKITDFGIARLTDTSRTKTGIILGTPSYMSPEQLAAAPVTGRSDLYSLGITMYQLLTGVAPFRADSIPKLMDKIMNDKHRPLTSIRDDIPVSVDRLLDKALAKDPNDRYANGRAMALALRECCTNF